jgi:hypothetical protein
MTETHIAGELYGLSAHPGDIYHRAAMTVEALIRERDEAREQQKAWADKWDLTTSAAEARIAELIALLDQQMGTPCEQIRHRQEIAAVRAAALEEAANVADGVGDKSRREIRSSLDASVIAAAIRALKEPS